jgi:peptidoglycan/xylan/chitin deacetylase (PgdA/CDA1 family)
MPALPVPRGGRLYVWYRFAGSIVKAAPAAPHSKGGGFSMKAILAVLAAAVAILVLALMNTRVFAADDAAGRAISITIDDLPAGAASAMSAAEITSMTKRLTDTLREQKIPVVAFVNERKLYYKWDEVNERIAALNMWLDAGFELGNHTYAHTSLNGGGLKAFEDGVIQGENVTRLLMTQHHQTLRYFRHPYLDTGRDLKTRRDAEQFLVERGYHIAPVTMDAWDWMFAGIYDDAKRRGDTALQQQVVKSYLDYTTVVFTYFEKLSRDLFGYEPKQILLMHANNLEAEHIGEVLDLLRKRGYKFVPLGAALSDSVYSLPDTFVGEEGGSWLEHWAITLGKPPLNEPSAPKDMLDRAAALPHPQP